jgi:TPR repeat protein
MKNVGTLLAQNNLGDRYYKGEGVKQDYDEALKWFRLAAAQGLALAQANIGAMYSEGHGVSKDYKEALKWFRLAAAQGDAFSQTGLGYFYLNGFGVQQDFVKSHMWSNLGAASGQNIASKNRDEVAKKMTPQQITDAQKLARECIASNYKNCD